MSSPSSSLAGTASMALAALLLVAGCPASVGGVGDLSLPPSTCTPGEARICSCLGGGEGQQSCQSDGRRYTACVGCPQGPIGDQGEPVPPLLTDGGLEPSGCGECEGCCAGTACVTTAAQIASACGPKGAACGACDAGQLCVAGTCVVDTGTCSPASCSDGCCSNNVCIPPGKHSWALCGGAGAACAACTYGVKCSGGCTTDIDPAASAFFIRVKYVGVQTQRWDLFDAADLLVCFGSGAQVGCARPCGDDSYGCNATASSGRVVDAKGNSVAFTGAALRAGLPIAVWDEDDFNDNDLIGNGTLAITTSQPSYATGAFVSVDQLSFEIY